MINHDVDTCKKKKEHIILVVTEATQPSQKPYKTSLYPCHICGLNGHKMTNAPPRYLMDSNASPKVKTSEGKKVRVHSLARNISGVKRRAGVPKWD